MCPENYFCLQLNLTCVFRKKKILKERIPASGTIDEVLAKVRESLESCLPPVLERIDYE